MENLAIDSISELPFSSVASMARPENLFRCPICAKLFRRSGNYSSHLRSHREEKPFKCRYCLNSYMQSSSLSRHMRIHAGARPLPCRLCGRSFSQTATLSEHMKQHVGEKHFQCSFCPAYFATPEGCRKHMENHTQDRPFQCSTCPASFHNISTLAGHMRLHRKAKPFKSADSLKSIAYQPQSGRGQADDGRAGQLSCNMCGKSFSQLRFLQMHKRIYTGEKRLKCRFCSRSFAQFCIFQQHLKSHSADGPPLSCQPSEYLSVEAEFQLDLTHCHLSDISDDISDSICCDISTAFHDSCSYLVDTFGCALCDKTFQIEKEFMDHCASHSLSELFDFGKPAKRPQNTRMPRFFGFF